MKDLLLYQVYSHIRNVCGLLLRSNYMLILDGTTGPVTPLSIYRHYFYPLETSGVNVSKCSHFEYSCQ